MFNPEPAKATMLYAHEVLSAGGDTIFANMHLAYEALSDGMKAMLVDVKTWCVGDRFKKDGGGKRADRYKGNTVMADKARDPNLINTECAASSLPVRTRKPDGKASRVLRCNP